MSIELAKAIFAAGFRVGHESGSDAASSHEWGTRPSQPQTADAAWEQVVEYRLQLDPEFSAHLEIDNPKSWEDVP